MESLRSESSDFAWDSETTSEDENPHDPVGRDVNTIAPAKLCHHLERLQIRARALLSVVEVFEQKVPEKIVGLAKLKNRIQRELHNSAKCCASIQLSSAEDDKDTLRDQMAKGFFLIKCSGIPTLDLFVNCLLTEPEIVSVSTAFPLAPSTSGSHDTNNRNTNIEVDLVSCNGRRWIKIRSARIRQEERSKFHGMICSLCDASKSCYVPFGSSPEVCVLFSYKPSNDFLSLIEETGARVGIRHLEGCLNSPSSAVFPPLPLKVDLICFDSTALVAFCSESCYTANNWSQDERLLKLDQFKVLREQQRREFEGESAVHKFIHPYLRAYSTQISFQSIESMVTCRVQELYQKFGCGDCRVDTNHHSWCYLPDLSWLQSLCESDARSSNRSKFDDGSPWLPIASSETLPLRNWIITDVSYEEFKWMIETIAGWNECQRAFILLQQCVVIRTEQFLGVLTSATACSTPYRTSHFIPNSPSWYTTEGGSISMRNRIVFGVSEALHALILTSNKQVCSKLQSHCVRIAAGLHPSRALTELKFSGEVRRDGPKYPPELLTY